MFVKKKKIANITYYESTDVQASELVINKWKAMEMQWQCEPHCYQYFSIFFYIEQLKI